MRHRHLDLPEGVWSTAAVHSAFERGGASDLWALFAAVRADPFGPAAAAAERAARTSKVYGYPALMLGRLEAWRRAAQRRGTS
jgi:hypothetical protein